MRSHLIVVGISLLALPAFAKGPVPAIPVDTGAKPTLLEETPVTNIKKGAAITLNPDLFYGADGEVTKMKNPLDGKTSPKMVIGTLHSVAPELHAYCSSKEEGDVLLSGSVRDCGDGKKECHDIAFENSADGSKSKLSLARDAQLQANVYGYSWFSDFSEARNARYELYRSCFERIQKKEKLVGKSSLLRTLNTAIKRNNDASFCSIEIKGVLQNTTKRIALQPKRTKLVLSESPKETGKAVVFKFEQEKDLADGEITQASCFNTDSVADVQSIFRLGTPPDHLSIEEAVFVSKEPAYVGSQKISTKKSKPSTRSAPVVTADDHVDEKGVIHKGHKPGGQQHQHQHEGPKPASKSTEAW